MCVCMRGENLATCAATRVEKRELRKAKLFWGGVAGVLIRAEEAGALRSRGVSQSKPVKISSAGFVLVTAFTELTLFLISECLLK